MESRQPPLCSHVCPPAAGPRSGVCGLRLGALVCLTGAMTDGGYGAITTGTFAFFIAGICAHFFSCFSPAMSSDRGCAVVPVSETLLSLPLSVGKPRGSGSKCFASALAVWVVVGVASPAPPPPMSSPRPYASPSSCSLQVEYPSHLDRHNLLLAHVAHHLHDANAPVDRSYTHGGGCRPLRRR
jgi:hypothetical protein